MAGWDDPAYVQEHVSGMVVQGCMYKNMCVSIQEHVCVYVQEHVSGMIVQECMYKNICVCIQENVCAGACVMNVCSGMYVQEYVCVCVYVQEHLSGMYVQDYVCVHTRICVCTGTFVRSGKLNEFAYACVR